MPNVEMLVVCTGKVRLKENDSKLATAIRPLRDGSAEGVVDRFFASPKMKLMRPGGVYRVEGEITEKSMTVVPSSWLYVEMYGDAEQVAAWQARTDAEEIAARAVKNHRDEAYGNQQLKAALGPLRKMYWETDHWGRLAIEVAVLNALRGK